MRPILYASITTLFVATALAAPGAALHCNGDITTIGTGPMILYMDDRSSETGELNHWFYMEDNGVEGLQSGGDQIWLYDWLIAFTDPCHHSNPDHLIL